MIDCRAHRGLSLAKRLNDARDRVSAASQIIERDSETMGDIIASTLVDHENRFAELEGKYDALTVAHHKLKSDYVHLVNGVNAALVEFDSPKASLSADAMKEIVERVRVKVRGEPF